MLHPRFQTVSEPRQAIFILILLFTAAAASAFNHQQPSGFVLRGTLENAAPDNTPYFKIGEAFVFMLPEDSALLPGARALEGRKVVVTLMEDR